MIGRRWSGLAVFFTLLGGLLVTGVAEAQEELFVSNLGNHSITVYRRTAGGNIAPIRTLSGGLTGLNGPLGIAVDLKNNELLVANSFGHSITAYSLNATGNTAPLRTLVGPGTGLSNPQALALDLTNKEGGVGIGTLYAVNANNSVTVYPWPSGGNTSPTRTIIGASTGLSDPRGIAVDLRYNELLVANTGAASVTVYNRIANGNSAPLRTLVGPNTGLNNPHRLVLDYTNLEGGPGVGVLYVANSVPPSITTHLWPNAGDAAPIRTISGPATLLDAPTGIALDVTNNELLVANAGGGASSVSVYSRTANGNTGPLRTLNGAATGLGFGSALAVAQSPRAVESRDFNGDGKPDLLWRENSGAVAIWLMNGTAIAGSAVVGNVSPDWSIVEGGDFNGDLKADLLWRNSVGTVAIWLMNGTTIAGSRVLGTVSPDWTIERVADYNGDGRSDILWRHTSGTLAIWLMNGLNIAETVFPGVVGTNWQLQ